MKLDEALEQVKKILLERPDNYGDPADNFRLIAKYWSVYLDVPISMEQVAVMMVLLKITRQQARHNDDNLLDMFGYVGCIFRIIESVGLDETRKGQ